MKHYKLYIKLKGEQNLILYAEYKNSRNAINTARTLIKEKAVSVARVEETETNTIYREEGD